MRIENVGDVILSLVNEGNPIHKGEKFISEVWTFEVLVKDKYVRISIIWIDFSPAQSLSASTVWKIVNRAKELTLKPFSGQPKVMAEACEFFYSNPAVIAGLNTIRLPFVFRNDIQDLVGSFQKAAALIKEAARNTK